MFGKPYQPLTAYPPAQETSDFFLTPEEQHNIIIRRLCDVTEPEKMAEYLNIPMEWFNQIIDENTATAILWFGGSYQPVRDFLYELKARGPVFMKMVITETANVVKDNPRKFERAMRAVERSVDQRSGFARWKRNTNPHGDRAQALLRVKESNLEYIMQQVDKEFDYGVLNKPNRTALCLLLRALMVQDRVGVPGSPLTHKRYRHLFSGWEKVTGTPMPSNIKPGPLF